MFNGIGTGIENLYLLSNAQTRSICPENPDGAKAGGSRTNPNSISWAPAREYGIGWKHRPLVLIPVGEEFVLADITGPGCIQQIWMTVQGYWRHEILRIYWDDQTIPSVECPVGDFFGCGWGEYAPLSSLAVCVNPGYAFNCYWQMPFQKRCRITLENKTSEEIKLYYQVNYCLTEVPVDAAYFHASFNRVNPMPMATEYTIVDGIQGKGHYVGTYMCWGVNHNGWWGEGEIKFFMDGDVAFPTICGTGTEDYFCGSYNFENRITKKYETFCTPYAGLCQVIQPDGLYRSQQRFGMYRWHLTDPIRFERDLKVTIQALGPRTVNGRFVTRQDDLASVAYWYQVLPTSPLRPLLSKDILEII